MKTKKGYILRSLGDEFVLVSEGADVFHTGRMVSMNESAALLWREVKGKDFDLKDMADLLVVHYDISREVAEKDAGALLQIWKNADVIEE